MDITNFVVSTRDQALLYGGHTTYHRLLVKKLHNLRKKLDLVAKNRSNFTKKSLVTAEQIAQSHDYLRLVLLTAERAWAHAMRLKAAHSTDAKGITGRTRSHIISRLDKGARAAQHLVQILSDTSITSATDVDLLEARAYAAMLRGAADFESQNWEQCTKNYAIARMIYSALMTSIGGDLLKDLLSETIDPSIRYAAYQTKVPRTMAISTIARNAFPSSDEALVTLIDKVAPSLLKQADSDTEKGPVDTPNAPQAITWRSREVKIEDASIALAIASTESATTQLAEKLASPGALPREMAAAYDEVLIASQDAADATKHAIDELKEEGVSQSDSRIQALQVTRTAVNYQMISWRIGRNRVLSGEHDGAVLDSAPNTTRKSKKDASSQKKPRIEPPGRKIARLKEKVVLYDATLQSLDSIKELPGVAADEELVRQLDATANYFHALRCLSIARSYLLTDQSPNALALVQHAYEQCLKSVGFFSQHGASVSESPILSIEIRQTDIQFLSNLLKGELQRCRAMVEIDNLRKKAKEMSSQTKVPLVDRLREYPVEGVDLTNLVDYPPRIQPIPVKPLFFDVAWNYIDYPGAPQAASANTKEEDTPAAEPKKRGWFGFGR